MNSIQAGIEKINDFVRQEIEKSKPIPKHEKGTDSPIDSPAIVGEHCKEIVVNEKSAVLALAAQMERLSKRSNPHNT